MSTSPSWPRKENVSAFRHSVPMLALVSALGTATSPLMELYEARDYFALRERLEEPAEVESVEDLFIRASVQHAFNRTEASNRTIDAALEKPSVSDELQLRLTRMKRANLLRLHRYREAHAASLAVATLPEDLSTAEERADDRNMERLLKDLGDVPPQAVAIEGETRLKMTRSIAGGLRLPVRFGSEERAFLPDTGANLSVLMRSEAEALGLDVRQAGVEVGTATGEKVRADVAVAEELTIGKLHFRNVIFLVFPDALLTFPEANFSIPGILGFPVLEAMGEMRFLGGDVLEVPKSPPAREARNLALDGLDLLVRVGYEDEALVCRLDSGAGKTVFYEPFYARYRGSIESYGDRRMVREGGVGTRMEIPSYVLPEVELALGNQTVRLEEVSVYTEAIVDEEDNDLFCNVGQDILSRFGGYVLNFRTMSFLLVGKQ